MDTDYYVRDAAGAVMAIYSGTVQKELPIYGASRLGIHYKEDTSNFYQLTDHLGNVRAVLAKDEQNVVAVTSATDYYPFGMPMPNRKLDDGGEYRYAYQGQEKDPETGKEAFQLRLWDSRIGRWLTTDPEGQYSSPYLGMGNNPINGVDPDGAWWWKKGAIRRAKMMGVSENGVTWRGLLKGGWGFNVSSGSEITSEGVTFNYKWASTDKGLSPLFNAKYPTGLAQSITNPVKLLGFWRNKTPENNTDLLAHIGIEMTYGTAENVYSIFSGKSFAGEILVGDHKANAALDGLVTVATFGYGRAVKSLGSIKGSFKGFNSFAKDTKGLFKGANHSTIRGKAYKEMIKNHNRSIELQKMHLYEFEKFNNRVYFTVEATKPAND